MHYVYKQTITLHQMKMEVIVGTVLGDACLPMGTGNPVMRVEFQQSIASAYYIWHLYEIFSNFVGAPPQVRNIRGGGAQDRRCIRFHTFRHNAFEFYDELFYTVDEHKKRVPKNMNELLTPRGLAYWFMDDRAPIFTQAVLCFFDTIFYFGGP